MPHSRRDSRLFIGMILHKLQHILTLTEVLKQNQFVKNKLWMWGGKKTKKEKSTEPSKEQINRNGTLKQT